MKKNIIIVTSIMAASLIAVPKASAINEEWAAVAGFVGGVLFQAATSDTHVSLPRVTYNHHVYSDSHYNRVQYRTQCTPRPAPPPSGYWKVIEDRRWIPGTWYYEYDECGRSTKYWREGYWDHFQRKVWVSSRHYY